MRKLTTKEFIERSRDIHGERYDYSLSVYKNRRTPIKIICKIHGIFEQYPDLHYQRSHGCDKCGGTFRLTTKEFAERATLVHDEKYDYSKVTYMSQKEKVEILCLQHGAFFQTPSDHLRGRGCPECYRFRTTQEYFIEKGTLIHKGKYDYSHSVYIDSRTRIEIICPKHGIFWQQPNNHLQGAGCDKCAQDVIVKSIKLTQDEFIKRAKATHGDRYDYSEATYIDIFKKVRIRCKEHGIFIQRPSDHLYGTGCPSCKTSRGERKVANTLSKLGIEFSEQVKFKDCRKAIVLRFDFSFRLGDRCFLIEYDGQQHFESVEYFGGEEYYNLVKARDSIKTAYAAANDFILIRIPYTQFDNIESILTSEIKKYF